MAMSVGTVLLSLATIFVLTTVTDGFLGCYRIHAVFTFRDTQFFVYGNHWMVGVDYSGNIVHWGYLTDTGFNSYLSAAVGIREEDMFYMMNGKFEQGFNNFNNKSSYMPLSRSGAEDALNENPYYGGIDAAFERPNGTAVYFAQCEYVTVDVQHMSYLEKGNMSDVNIPCHVDAAWSSPDQRIGFINKGLKVWRWVAGEDKAEGPFHLFDIFCSLSTFLCPA